MIFLAYLGLSYFPLDLFFVCLQKTIINGFAMLVNIPTSLIPQNHLANISVFLPLQFCSHSQPLPVCASTLQTSSSKHTVSSYKWVHIIFSYSATYLSDQFTVFFLSFSQMPLPPRSPPLLLQIGPVALLPTPQAILCDFLHAFFVPDCSACCVPACSNQIPTFRSQAAYLTE